MHWVIQENLYDEEGLRELKRVLERIGVPYSVHKVVPFSGELIPKADPTGPVVAIGAYSMIHYARKRAWIPGVWSNINFDFPIWAHHWGDHCLNSDAEIHFFATVPKRDLFFMRPCMDSKAFSGGLFEWKEYLEWRHRIEILKEDTGTTLTPATPVLVCQPKTILREYRLWVVDKRVVTASLYKIGDRVQYDSNVDDDVIEFGTRMAETWSPDRAYVLDVAMTDESFKIVEINSLNAAGLYAGNVGKLVEAIELMGY